MHSTRPGRASLKYNKKNKDFVIGLLNQTHHSKNHPKFLTHLVFLSMPQSRMFLCLDNLDSVVCIQVISCWPGQLSILD